MTLLTTGVFTMRTLERLAGSSSRVEGSFRIFRTCMGGDFTVRVIKGRLELTDIQRTYTLIVIVSGNDVGKMVANAIGKALLEKDGLLIDRKNWLRVHHAVTTPGVSAMLKVKNGHLDTVSYEGGGPAK